MIFTSRLQWVLWLIFPNFTQADSLHIIVAKRRTPAFQVMATKAIAARRIVRLWRSPVWEAEAPLLRTSPCRSTKALCGKLTDIALWSVWSQLRSQCLLIGIHHIATMNIIHNIISAGLTITKCKAITSNIFLKGETTARIAGTAGDAMMIKAEQIIAVARRLCWVHGSIETPFKQGTKNCLEYQSPI